MSLRTSEDEAKRYIGKLEETQKELEECKRKNSESQRLLTRLYEERDKIIEDHQRLAMICEEKTNDSEKKGAIVGKLQMKLFMALAELDRVTKGQAQVVMEQKMEQG